MGHLFCPDCNELMMPFSCQNVVVDKCGHCHGIWFDSKDFGVFKRTLDSYDLAQILEINRPPDPEAVVLSSCPRCEIPLFETNYSYKSKVLVKKCDRCLGWWLPIHQILNLVELAKVGQAIAPDVRELATELNALEANRQKNLKLKKLGDGLNEDQIGWPYIGSILPQLAQTLRRLFYE